jgi:hypothetical protein
VRKPEHTEFAKRWSGISGEIRSVLAKNPYGLVYQVVVKAVPDHAAGEAISLMSLQVMSGAPSFRNSLKAGLRSCLSAKMYSRLRLLAAKMGMNFKG